MKDRIRLAQGWIKKQPPRDQFYIFLAGFGVIYLLFYMFFYKPIHNEHEQLKTSIATAETQNKNTADQMASISQAVQDPTFLTMLQEYQRLNALLSKIQGRLEKLRPRLIVSQDIAKVINNILTVESQGVEFIRMDELPVELWLKDAKDKTALANLLTNELYKHAFLFEFQSDYFNTVKFLKNIEKLPWPLYWDSMEYKVIKYPRANVKIEFHLLSFQKR